MLDSRILDTLASTTLEADEDEHEHTDSCRRTLVLERKRKSGKRRRSDEYRLTYEEMLIFVGWE